MIPKSNPEIPTASQGWLFLALALALSSLIWSGLFFVDPEDNPWTGGGSMSPALLLLFMGGGSIPTALAIAFAFRRGSWRAVGALLARALPRKNDLPVALAAIALALAAALVARAAGGALGAGLPRLNPSAAPQAVAMALAAALMEEFGWRGTALPALSGRFGLPVAGTVVGVTWAVWHTVGALWSVAPFFGGWFWAYYLTGIIGVMAGAGMTLAVLWEQAQGRLFPILAFHTAFSASATVFVPSAGSARSAVVVAACFAAAHIAIGLLMLRWRSMRRGG